MGYRINVKNAAIAEVTEDTNEGYELGEVIQLPGLMHIDLSLLMANGELYGDGALSSKISKITGAVIKFGINKVPLEGRVLLNGSTLTEDGILDISTEDQPKKVAFYAETEGDDGNKEQLWALAGKAQPFGVSAKQSEGNITYSTDEVTIDFTRRKLDKKVVRLGDTEYKKFTEEKSKAFALHPDMKTPVTGSTGETESGESTETTTD